MLGIDTSKATLVSSLVDPHAQTLLWQEEVPNNRTGFQRLHERTPAECAWVLEPTGRYGQDLVRYANEVGRRVLLAEPRRAKLFLRSVRPRAKTDRLDSFGLALFALSQPLRAYPQKRAGLDKLDQLLSARRGLSQALTRLSEQQRELPYARESLRPAVADLRARLKELDQAITQAAKEAEAAAHVARLQAVPGIGPVTAAALASRLLAKEFTTTDQLVAYVGLDVRVLESGKRKGVGYLTKRGDAELRRLLFNCARAAVKTRNGPFKAQYQREREKGLSSTAAYCAVARKLARLAWALVQYERTYDAARVYTRPTKETPAATVERESAGRAVAPSPS
jgi:transposase